MAEDREKLFAQGPADEPAVNPPPRSARVSRGQQRRRQRSVFQYITILFAAALVLLLYTFMMERRQFELQKEQDQANISDLQQQSTSAVQRLEGLISENEQLKTQTGQLKEQLEELQGQLDAAEEEQGLLRAEVQGEQRSGVAMQYFWQINEAYVRGRTTLCKQLITELEEWNFQNALPKDNITGTDRFSPYDRYMEIRDKVIK